MLKFPLALVYALELLTAQDIVSIKIVVDKQ
nr:MAG TPA: hypothetical protein [Caudoviricetes sp.]